MSERIDLNDSSVLRELVYNELENSVSENSVLHSTFEQEPSPAKKVKLISTIENPIAGPSCAPDILAIPTNSDVLPESLDVPAIAKVVSTIPEQTRHRRATAAASFAKLANKKSTPRPKQLFFPELDFHSSDSSFEPDDTDADKDYDPADDDYTYSSDVSAIIHVDAPTVNHLNIPDTDSESPRPLNACSTPIPGQQRRISRPRPRQNRPNQTPHHRRRTFIDSESEASESDSSDDDFQWTEVGPEHNFPDPPTPFLENVGPKHMPSVDSSPMKYFDLFFTTSLLMLMVEETNRYASKYINETQLKDKSRVKEWLPVTINEMKAFIACILNMGLVRKPTTFSYWTKLPSVSNTSVSSDVS